MKVGQGGQKPNFWRKVWSLNLTSLTAPPLPRFFSKVNTLIWWTPYFFEYSRATYIRHMNNDTFANTNSYQFIFMNFQVASLNHLLVRMLRQVQLATSLVTGIYQALRAQKSSNQLSRTGRFSCQAIKFSFAVVCCMATK